MKEYDYLIVGAGLFGAVFAQEAYKSGKKCLILEKRPHIAGNLYTEKQNNIYIHRYGAHIFHTHEKAIWDYITQFGEFNNYIHTPVANYQGTIYPLPFNMYTFSRLWNISTPAEAESKILEQQDEISYSPHNLEEQAIKLVGRDVYAKMIKGYTEKQWGCSCKELPADIIKRLPVRYTFNNNYFNDRYQGIPNSGYTSLIEKMLAGCDIALNTDYLADREHYNALAESIICTCPIDAFFDYCYGALAYRSLRWEDKILSENNFQGTAVVNYTDSSPEYTRCIEHKHFTFSKDEKGCASSGTIVSFEYGQNWQIGKEPYYPINDNKNRQLYEKYHTLAKALPNIYFGGRLGEYKYYDMDDTIISALNLSKQLLTE